MKAVAAGMNPMDLQARHRQGRRRPRSPKLKTHLSKPTATSKEIAQVGTISANSDDSIGEHDRARRWTRSARKA